MEKKKEIELILNEFIKSQKESDLGVLYVDDEGDTPWVNGKFLLFI
jgi:hypothetical protein